MWAGSITLRIGEYLVGIRADEESALHALRQMFGPWEAEGVEAIPAFSIRVGEGDAKSRARRLHLLNYGGTVMARQRSLEGVLGRLSEILGGFLASQHSATTPPVALRVFERNGRAVLTDVPYPDLVDDRTLGAKRITEAVCWAVIVEAGGRELRLPAPLLGEAPERTLTLAGVIAGRPGGQGVTDLARAVVGDVGRDWFRLLALWTEQQALHTAANRIEARDLVTQLLIPE